jgi:hypothetical protein
MSNPSNKKSSPYEDVHFIDASKPVWNYSLFSEETELFTMLMNTLATSRYLYWENKELISQYGLPMQQK